jgi:hypothetical protein
MLCGILLSRPKGNHAGETPADGETFSPELRRQYEALFGYDGCREPEE